MAATITNLKTQVQARIDTANGVTSLKDLLIIRKAADGLGCNETNLDTLITNALNAMNGATELKDLLIGNKASDLVDAGFKNKVQITSSQNWTVPDGVYRLEVWTTGGGGGGEGRGNAVGTTAGGTGGNASHTISTLLSVSPGDILQVVVGAKGLGGQGSSGTSGAGTLGGTSEVYLKGKIVAISSPNGAATANLVSLVRPGGPGGGGSGAGGGLDSAKCNLSDRQIIAASNQFYTGSQSPIATGGLPGGSGGAAGGGGGGCSWYGAGGNGANGTTGTAAANTGISAAATNYGAAGGGSSGTSGSVPGKGGDGANGIVEIYY